VALSLLPLAASHRHGHALRVLRVTETRDGVMTDTSTQRDPLTGRLKYPVTVQLHLADETMPRLVSCGSWNAALGYLDSGDFAELKDRLEFVTITGHKESG
jgi:hypothetical protein